MTLSARRSAEHSTPSTFAHEFLSAALGSETQSNLLVAPEGYAAVGKRCLMMVCDVVKHSVKTVATNLVMASAEFQSSSGINHGVILHAHEAETATGNAPHRGGERRPHARRGRAALGR